MKKLIITIAFMLIAGGLFAQADSTNFELKRNQTDGEYNQVQNQGSWWGKDSATVNATLTYQVNSGNVGTVSTVDSIGILTELTNVTTVGTVTEITNGHIYTSDTTQKKYRASYTLTSTGADTIFQDTAYGNFKEIYIGYSDTGVTTSAGITDSCIVELWDALLSVWKPVGVINMWNGNHYLYISPGSGLNAEYKLDHYIVDIFRIRFVNTQVGLGTRTGTVSWSGKADR